MKHSRFGAPLAATASVALALSVLLAASPADATSFGDLDGPRGLGIGAADRL